jgi:hypothetical protein
MAYSASRIDNHDDDDDEQLIALVHHSEFITQHFKKKVPHHWGTFTI